MTVALPPIGRVFTPLIWAKWLVQKSGAFEVWQQGGEILDPTCGDGVFLEAFIDLKKERGEKASSEQISRLYGIEIMREDKRSFLLRMKEKYSLDFPSKNFICGDILDARTTKKADFLIGNPPWSNFSDLPQQAKEQWSPAFIAHGLVKSKGDVLLGKSRVDICALIIKKSIDKNLQPNGTASFFVPLSILFNDGANDQVRPYPSSNHSYAISSVWDFQEEKIFEDIATRYGAVDFVKGLKQTWPVKTWVLKNGGWCVAFSTSSDKKSSGWIRHNKRDALISAPKILASVSNKPRQGVNTCGANDVFIFQQTENGFIDSKGFPVKIEKEILFPLMQKSLFVDENIGRVKAKKWIMVPYNRKSGRVLSWNDLSKFPYTQEYLIHHEQKLRSRKGVLIRGNIEKGIWWSLLGVGEYSFAPWKVAWESLGKKVFRPALLRGEWQGNQAMHAYCPCATREEAEFLLEALKGCQVENWLKSFSMDGTCNWAQPGKVSKVFDFHKEQPSLL